MFGLSLMSLNIGIKQKYSDITILILNSFLSLFLLFTPELWFSKSSQQWCGHTKKTRKGVIPLRAHLQHTHGRAEEALKPQWLLIAHLLSCLHLHQYYLIFANNGTCLLSTKNIDISKINLNNLSLVR